MDLLIVEDDVDICTVLSRAAAECELFLNIYCSYTLTDAQSRLNRASPAMILCDIGLPDGDGLKLLVQARARQIPVIVISAMGDKQTVIRAIELGASGYLQKDLLSAEISAAIRQVFEGGSPLSPSIATHILRRLQSPGVVVKRLQGNSRISGGAAVRPLTQREEQILRLVARGYLLSEVASVLGISSHTVSNHNRNIYRKLSAHSRTEAVSNAVAHGILALD